MVRRGLAAVLGRVELREGMLHRMNAQYAPHFQAKMAIFRTLDAAMRDAAPTLEVGVEATVSFGGGFAPLPDIIVWKPVRTSGGIPASAVRLVVEVSDSTLSDDLGPKRAAYAQAGLPEYWVLDLGARVLHQFANPQDGVYTSAGAVPEGGQAQAATIPGLAVEVRIPA